jgi:hypothetical protein
MVGKVEATQDVMTDGQRGHGFVVRDDRGKQCMTVAFSTAEDAKAAEAQFRALLEKAEWVRSA